MVAEVVEIDDVFGIDHCNAPEGLGVESSEVWVVDLECQLFTVWDTLDVEHGALSTHMDLVEDPDLSIEWRRDLPLRPLGDGTIRGQGCADRSGWYRSGDVVRHDPRSPAGASGSSRFNPSSRPNAHSVVAHDES